MNALKIVILGLFAGLLCATASAQTSRFPLTLNTRQLHIPPKAQHVRSPMYRYLASDEGRAWMQVSGDPRSSFFNRRFGGPSSVALEQARTLLRQLNAQPQQVETEPAPGSAPCNGKAGVRFNLEPRANALPQFEATADFILNGAGTGSDLIVQAADDARANVNNGKWDGSISGYYVHASSTSDCSVQFEGGLPNFGNTLGLGEAVVAADSVRGAFFMADNRLPGGVALFRAAATDLLNPAKCPNGTHTQQQAESCWMQTPPVQVDASDGDNTELGLAVDERATGAGKGAGDVYLVGEDQSVYIVACTDLLKCSSMVSIDTGDGYNAPFVQVRADGTITVSYMQQITGKVSQLVEFVTCTPAGAPKAPVCGKPTTVATVANPLFLGGSEASFVGPLGFSYTQHANRQESDGSLTTFLVYDDCTNAYVPPPPPNDQPTYCLSTRVHVTFSTDNGQTWSPPAVVDTKSGFHVFPTITNDASTGTVSIAHYSTEGDYFEHEIRVVLNQIAAGSTALGPPQTVTSFTPTDDPPGLGFQIVVGFDLYMGAVAHGTGKTGESHLYLSFDSEAANGTYNGKPLPELNNQIKLLTF
jgi:hypothetical protein